MSLFKRVRAAGTRRAGLALGGLMTVGLAVVTGTALASSSAPAASSGMAGMTSMVSSGSRAHVTGNITTNLFLFFSVLH